MDSLVQLAVDQGATNADWLEAWATVVAAVGTVGAFIWQGRALRHERQTRQAEIARLEASQARTVVLHDKSLAPSELHAVPGRSGAAVQAILGNYGDQPITDVTAILQWKDLEGVVHEGAQIPVYPVVAGGETKRLTWVMKDNFSFTMPKATWEKRESQLSIFLTFRDVHGVLWSVREGRQPVRLSDPA